MGETQRANMMGQRVFMIALMASLSVALPTTDLVVPEAKYAGTSGAEFVQSTLKSGGTEAQCRTFATLSISGVSAGVTSEQGILAAVDTGSGCAQEGQSGVATATTNKATTDADVVTKTQAVTDATTTQTAACNAPVTMVVNLPTVTATTCYDYTQEASFQTVQGACDAANTALSQANSALGVAQTAAADAQTALDAAVAEAARLMSECHCRVQNERAVAWTAAGAATASHALEWKQAHEIICALDQTSTCTVPSCPAVTQPAAASGVDAEDCSATIDNCQVVYDPDHSGNGETEHPWSATLKGKPNTYYTITYDVLNSDLASSSERLDRVVVGGVTMPGCGGAGDNRPDYQCDFTPCASGGSQTVSADASGSIAVTATYSGNSMDCHCDQTNPVGNCKSEVMNHASTHGWTPTKAALKFYLTEAANKA